MFALGMLCIPSCIAVKGVSPQCCDLAKNSSAFINTRVPQSSYTCGQQFSPTKNPAPVLSVSLSWCKDNCAGYALYPPSETNAWALPLVTFILAAVIFSMTIPRRLSSHAPHLSLPWLPYSLILNLLFSLILDALILTIDTVFWVFAIMIATAPFILSGLFELIIDYKVTRYASKAHDQLAKAEIVELLTAVLAGNLNMEGVPVSVNPQQELKRELNITEATAHIGENISVRLSDMLDGQVSFSTTVGAPVLLYLGSFIYSIVSLNGTEGDKDTARALAFGIWWMIIVHVSVISGSLLASNNPSSASIIFPKQRVPLDRRQRWKHADNRSGMEDILQAKIEAYLPLSLCYNNRYEPVWMWTRGKNKALWLRETEAWKNRPWVRERLNLSAWNWLFLIVGSYFLVFLPCALAFWIEYATPPVGFGCRAVTILVYAVCQFIFVILSAWSHFKAVHSKYWRKHKRLDKWVSGVVAILFLLPSWITAVFTTFAGTLMQITGIYQNCWCAARFPSHATHATVSLASDTEEDRRSSRYWSTAGYIAVGGLFVVTYCGWWGQRYLRAEFLDRVDHLMQGQNDTHIIDGVAQDQSSTSGSSSISNQGNANTLPLKPMTRRSNETLR